MTEEIMSLTWANTRVQRIKYTGNKILDTNPDISSSLALVFAGQHCCGWWYAVHVTRWGQSRRVGSRERGVRGAGESGYTWKYILLIFHPLQIRVEQR